MTRNQEAFERELRQLDAAYRRLNVSYNIRHGQIPNREVGAIYGLLSSVQRELGSLGTPLGGHPDVQIGRTLIESRDRRLSEAKSTLDKAREAMSKYLYGPQDFEDAKGLAALSREELEAMKASMDPEDFGRASRELGFADSTQPPTEGNDYTFETDFVLYQAGIADRIIGKYKTSGEPKDRAGV